jgi:hypothetical protein
MENIAMPKYQNGAKQKPEIGSGFCFSNIIEIE